MTYLHSRLAASFTVPQLSKETRQKIGTIGILYRPLSTICLSMFIIWMELENKKDTAINLLLNNRGSRHTAHAAKALRWRVDKLLKRLIKKKTLSS